MPDHLSYSQVSMMLRCPRQYEYRYIDGLIRPPSGALVLGSAFHTAAEHNYTQKIESDEDSPEDELTDVFRESLKERCEEDVEFDPGEDEGSLADLGTGLVKVFRKEVMPGVHPVAVETRYELDLVDEIKLVAIVDVEDRAGKIRDNKTASKKPSQGNVDKDMQLTTYALVKRLLDKEETGLCYDVTTKTKTPKAYTFETTRTEEQCLWQVELIRQVARLIQGGVFPPNPTGNLCSEKWCGYWDECHKASGKLFESIPAPF